MLEEQGYIRRKGNNYELTPRGTRKIGQKALGEIYSQLKNDSFGKHADRATTAAAASAPTTRRSTSSATRSTSRSTRRS